MTTAYFLFGLCALAFVSVGVLSMVGGDKTTSKAMKDRLARRAAKQSQQPQTSATQGTVSAMPGQAQSESVGGRHAA